MIELPTFRNSSNTNHKIIIESISTYKNSITAESGDFHVSGLIITDLLSKTNSTTKVRTLLDSGSGTNFISEKILPFLNYEHIATKNMEITGINSTEIKKADLVRIFFNNNDCPIKSLKCYTMPDLLIYNTDKSAYNNMILKCKKNF